MDGADHRLESSSTDDDTAFGTSGSAAPGGWQQAQPLWPARLPSGTAKEKLYSYLTAHQAGADTREFWQRAEDRNRSTAELYDKLGLAEYEAIEGFVRWKQ